MPTSNAILAHSLVPRYTPATFTPTQQKQLHTPSYYSPYYQPGTNAFWVRVSGYPMP
jgi:hypothetical protein